MVLLIESIRVARMEAHAMWIVPERRVGVRHEQRFHPFVQRVPVAATIVRLEHPAARHADVDMAWIAGIDENRVELRAVRRAVLIAAAPRLALRMIIEAVDAGPSRAAVGGTEQTLRRSA